MENELEKVLESKFFCPSRFAQEIESLVQTHQGMSYIDAIIHFCEMNNIDVESVPKLISKPLKEKIRYEATEQIGRATRLNSSHVSESRMPSSA